MATNIFINLPVRDLEKTKIFFSALGFSFNPQFTDDNAACMVISDDIYAMLITEKYFVRFTKKEIVNAKKMTEVLNAISVESREKVDEMLERATKAGGKEHREPEDYGWMYGRSVEDLDGHIWEFIWIDITKAPPSPSVSKEEKA